MLRYFGFNKGVAAVIKIIRLIQSLINHKLLDN